MTFKPMPLFYLCLLYIIFIANAQRGGRGNGHSRNPSEAIEGILTENPNIDIFATESALEAEVKSGVLIQIFNNNTSYDDIKEIYANWAEEAGVEFEFVMGELDIEYIVEENAEGVLNVIITVASPETENEAIFVNTEGTVKSEGNVALTTNSVSSENNTENVVVVINEPQTQATSGTTAVPTTEAVATPQVLGGGGSNCQEVVTCQDVTVPKVGVKKVCSTNLECS